MQVAPAQVTTVQIKRGKFSVARVLSLEVADKFLERDPFIVVLVQFCDYVAELAAVEAF